MKDTDTIDLCLTITVRQARYLKRKLLDLAKVKKAQAKRTGTLELQQERQADSDMLKGIAVYLEALLEEQGYIRAESRAECEECDQPFIKHRLDKNEPWLNVLCNGRKVKL